MTKPIRGKVARILNSRDMVINVGSGSGVVVGMRFDVMDARGEDVEDPDTGEVLGSVERSKVRVEISRGLWLPGLATAVKMLTVVQFWDLWHNCWRDDRGSERAGASG